MKRLVLTMVVACLIHPFVSLAASLIHLKNGRSLIAEQHWEEGNEVRFYLYGGMVGIQKDFIQKIEQSDLAIKELKVTEEAPAEKSEAKAAPQPSETAKKPAPTGDKKEEDQLKEFSDQFASLREKFKKSSSMARSELGELGEELVGLRRKILQSKFVPQFTQELAQIDSMAAEAEEAFKARGQ